jgi:AAA ATPase domain/Trypsin-like peptidase domain
VQTQAGKVNAELSYKLLRQSIVKIVTPRQERIGFFVARDTILTCPHILKDTDLESIKINQGGRTHKVVKCDTNLSIDVTTIQIDIDEDQEVICAKLDDSYQVGDELYLCPYPIGRNSISPKKVDYQNSDSSNGSIKFVATQIDGMFSGSPLLNSRTGKIHGIVRLHGPKTLDRQDRINKIRGEAISIASIFKEFSELKSYNNNFHNTKALSNLPNRSYDQFIGRESEIKQILAYISPSHRQHLIVVDGVAGIGKTSLVTKVAYQCLHEKQIIQDNQDTDKPIFDAIIYTSLNNHKLSTKFSSFAQDIPNIKLLNIIRNIADVLNVSELKQAYDERKFTLAYEYLSRQNTLLIVDGIEDIDSNESIGILDFLNNLPISTKAIITTREKALFHSQVSLVPLSYQETIELIGVQVSLKRINITPDQIQKIWGFFNGLPLATLCGIGEYTARYSLSSTFDIESMLNKSNELDLAKLCFKNTLHLLDKQTCEMLISLAFFRGSASREALLAITKSDEKTLSTEDSLGKLQQFYPFLKSYIRGGEERYNILPIAREYILDELEKVSEHNLDFESGARTRWIDWYKDFTNKYGGYNMEVNNYNYYQIEQEIENIGEVLSWCASHQKYVPIKGIWNNIDFYMEAEGHWMTRFYWWEYLEKEAQKKGETSFYVKALSEKISTWIEMGQSYYVKAINSLIEALNLSNYSDKSVQADLKSSWEKLGGENFTGIDIRNY